MDLARFLIGSPIVTASGFPVQGGDGRLGDCMSMHLSFADGSIATIHYLSNGNKSFPKERVEIFCSGDVYVCDNFRHSSHVGGSSKVRTRKQDKGHSGELNAFFQTLRNGGAPPITREEIFEVSQVSIELRP